MAKTGQGHCFWNNMMTTYATFCSHLPVLLPWLTHHFWHMLHLPRARTFNDWLRTEASVRYESQKARKAWHRPVCISSLSWYVLLDTQIIWNQHIDITCRCPFSKESVSRQETSEWLRKLPIWVGNVFKCLPNFWRFQIRVYDIMILSFNPWSWSSGLFSWASFRFSMSNQYSIL